METYSSLRILRKVELILSKLIWPMNLNRSRKPKTMLNWLAVKRLRRERKMGMRRLILNIHWSS
jgi:hypothetical protein